MSTTNHKFFICTSKFGLDELCRSVREIDPRAFITVQEDVQVYGNYIKKLG